MAHLAYIAHFWSGFPGGYCIKCGEECKIAIAIGSGYYNPITDTWQSPELEQEYTDLPCKVSDQDYEQKTGHKITPS